MCRRRFSGTYKIILFCLLVFFAGALTIKLNKIVVPTHCKVGDDAELECSFGMQGEPLYSVKWYKDDMEFYRFVPNDSPKLQVFPLLGIHVDVSALIASVRREVKESLELLLLLLLFLFFSIWLLVSVAIVYIPNSTVGNVHISKSLSLRLAAIKQRVGIAGHPHCLYQSCFQNFHDYLYIAFKEQK